MLISLTHQFIFVANLKTASSSIEKSLRPFCEIAIPQTGYGKHASFAAIEHRFPWVFQYVKREEFFVFGVLRDPVDYVLSIYNSHTKPDFIGFPHYTGDMAFFEFYEAWRGRRSWQMEPQTKRFVDSNGSFAADYVLDYERLNEQWPWFCRVLGVPDVELGRHNRSPEGVGRMDLAASIIDRIYDDYAVDYECLCACAGFVEAGRPDPRPGLAV